MNDWIVLAKVKCVNAMNSNEIDTDYIVLTEVGSLAEAASRIEDFYGTDLVSVNITFAEGPFIRLEEDQFNKLWEAAENGEL